MSWNTGTMQADVYLRQIRRNRDPDIHEMRSDALPGKLIGIADRLDIGCQRQLA
jgi:hypothetical protein